MKVRISSFDLVAIGAVAGASEALVTVLSNLPRTFPAAIAIAEHGSGRPQGLLARLLNGRSSLPVVEARNGEPLVPGMVYLAPTERHLLIGEGQRMIVAEASHKYGFTRPVDPLFRSAARVYKSRLIAVLLSGATGDGSAATVTVKDSGGIVVALEEASSRRFAVSGSVIAKGVVDHLLPLRRIAPALHSLVSSGLYEP